MKYLAGAFWSLSGVVSWAVLGACSDAAELGPGAGGAGSGSGGTASTAGGVPAGGSVGASGAAGTAAQSGGSGAGGAAGSASGSGGGGGGGGVTTGGGGAGGVGGVGGAGGKVAPNPSMGCNKQNPQTGSAGSPLTVSGHQYYVKLPTGYDPTKAYPTMIMFNPTNNPIDWAEKSAGFEATGPKESWIRVYPHPANTNAGWGAGDVAFFEPLYEQITGSYCIDKARVFAAGESSGGDFSSILGCEHGDKLRAIGPCATKNVPQYPLDADERQCKGDVTAVIIHGKNDSVVGTENGPKTRDFYVAVNHCMSMTMPVTGYTDKLSNCVMFQGCDAGTPVYWCQHEDPNYGNTNHGWPAFAPKFLYSLFSQL
jgi:poly(3-hydroxybutyrate) depolymerase